MERLFCLHRILLLVLLISPCAVLAQDPVRFGIFPYVSPGKLVQFHRPLKDYLERTLQRPVGLVSAPDFESFVQRTDAGEYDYILTAPHMGRLAEVRSGYQRIAHTLHVVQGIFLARADSGIHTLADLENKTVTMAARVSIIFQMAEYKLQQLGLKDGENLTIRETSTHNNAMYSPLRGESDASVTGILLWNKLGHTNKQQLRVIGTTPEIPGFMLMANAHVPAEEVARVRRAVLDFKNTQEGETYFRVTGLQGFTPIADETMESLDPYIKVFDRR